MSLDDIKNLQLGRHYCRFLATENSAGFVESVCEDYTIATLEKLVHQGNSTIRRAAALALGFCGEFECNESLGRALRDSDRGVRLLADHGIRQLWFRAGSPMYRPAIVRSAWLNRCGKHEEALELAHWLITADPDLAEAWNQQANAQSGLDDHESSIQSRKEVLYLNRYHFPAASCMATSYLQQDEVILSLESFRLALDINPDLDNVRSQIGRLERIVGG